MYSHKAFKLSLFLTLMFYSIPKCVHSNIT